MSAKKCAAALMDGRPCRYFALPGTDRCGHHPDEFAAVPADGQPRLEDGTVDVRALCARWDADANRGAGEAR
jgi:hypothetical protein